MSITTKLAEERRARLAAERLLELKQAELFAANRKLGRRAEQLTEDLSETRAQIASFRDENARVKSDLTVAHRKVEIAERRLWHSIETMQDGFAMFDDNDTLIAANRAYLTVFDGLEEIAPGVQYPRILQLATEEGMIDPGEYDTAEWRAMMMERWQSTSPEPLVVRLWNGRFIKLIDQRGENGGDVVSLALDITSTVRYEERLRAAQVKAESANRAKSAFLANMSHEIRTPMNGVVGMADLLQETPLTEDQSLYVDTIRNSGEALLTIINDVLDYSKIEADKIVLRQEPFDLEYILQEVAMLLQPSAREKGIALLVDYDIFTCTRFMGDGGRLRQVLTNLIGNAVKFTKEGHVLVRVVGTQDAGHMALRIVVEDTGIGIPEDKQAHIFGEFNQVEGERNRKFEGTGLGLAISQRLVNLMGGEVWLSSVVDEGSSFGIGLQLPIDGPPEPELVPLPDALSHVLVIEPQPTHRAILERLLTSLGKKVSAVPNTVSLPEAPWDIALIGEAVPKDSLSDLAGGLQLALGPATQSKRQLLAEVTRAYQDAHPEPVAARDVPGVLDVLLAEDNKTNRLVFSKMVAGLPLELRCAENGQQAVAEVARQRPDIVFMDISMPIMDGKQATACIRADYDPEGSLPIVAVTAHAMAGDADGILAAGLDGYLTKPIKKAAILEMLAKHCPRVALSQSA